MSYKWIGSILIIGSCTGFGISIAVRQMREESLLRQLCRILDEMLWELPFQLTPLPELRRSRPNGQTGAPGCFELYALGDAGEYCGLPQIAENTAASGGISWKIRPDRTAKGTDCRSGAVRTAAAGAAHRSELQTS